MAYSSQSSAAHVLSNNGVIVHQTDTVIGLACLPNEKLLSRLSRIKHRHHQKSFIVLASSLDQVTDFIHTSESTLKSLETITQQPTTWLVDANQNVPSQLIGATNKIAIRMTNHVGVKAICDKVGAIASTSANISDQPICKNIQQARDIFGPNIDYIDQNQTPGTGKSSTIIDLSSGECLRE